MKDTLNRNEWIVMGALWEKSPMTLSETIKQIGNRANWNYKTYQSYMVILEKKGYISAEKRGRDKFYFPILSREECVKKEGQSLMDKLGSESIKLLMANMVRESDLEKEDYAELMDLLEAILKREDKK